MSAAAGLLSGFHAIIAMQRNEPHWMLSDADANRYGQALANALRHMPIRAAQKTIDYSTFVMMVFVMETPRIAKSVQLARAGAQPAPRPAAPVFQFVRPSQPPSPTTPPASPTTPPANSGAPPDLAVGPPDGSGFGGDAAE